MSTTLRGRKIKDASEVKSLTLRLLHQKLTRMMVLNDMVCEGNEASTNANDLPITIFMHDSKGSGQGKHYSISYVTTGTRDVRLKSGETISVNEICGWKEDEF